MLVRWQASQICVFICISISDRCALRGVVIADFRLGELGMTSYIKTLGSGGEQLVRSRSLSCDYYPARRRKDRTKEKSTSN